MRPEAKGVPAGRPGCGPDSLACREVLTSLSVMKGQDRVPPRHSGQEGAGKRAALVKEIPKFPKDMSQNQRCQSYGPSPRGAKLRRDFVDMGSRSQSREPESTRYVATPRSDGKVTGLGASSGSGVVVNPGATPKGSAAVKRQAGPYALNDSGNPSRQASAARQQSADTTRNVPEEAQPLPQARADAHAIVPISDVVVPHVAHDLSNSQVHVDPSAGSSNDHLLTLTSAQGNADDGRAKITELEEENSRLRIALQHSVQVARNELIEREQVRKAEISSCEDEIQKYGSLSVHVMEEAKAINSGLKGQSDEY